MILIVDLELDPPFPPDVCPEVAEVRSRPNHASLRYGDITRGVVESRGNHWKNGNSVPPR